MFERLGEVLTVLRLLRRMSQGELAERAGIRATQVSRYETGQVQPQLAQLEKLLVALEVGLPEFLFTLLHVERLLRVLDATERLPEETMVRDAVTAHWNRISDHQLRVVERMGEVIREEFAARDGRSEGPDG